eukprot:TRINITY_DN7361_c0_g2_i2.p1 TRINITY_DN7361_c0_g2~~TRINITY_DN7361_c0_g2_i2.p1  ORF type:complete len:104 (-),score=11.22 TRINITY_DN7361_c0_g2_i2:406-717(-)
MASPIQGKKKDINFSHGPWVFYRRILRGRPRILHGGISRESPEVEKWCPKQQPREEHENKHELHIRLQEISFVESQSHPVQDHWWHDQKIQKCYNPCGYQRPR